MTVPSGMIVARVWPVLPGPANPSALGPIGPDFGSACDQIDRADTLLAGQRHRISEGMECQ